MHFDFLTVLTFFYSISGLISLLAYFPTIKDVWNGIPSANIESYFLWTINGCIALLYGIFKLQDIPFIILSGIGFICCLVILILRLRIKNKVSEET